MKTKWIPQTPSGTVCADLEADTCDQAWENLLKDAAHMPYKGREGFMNRGYTVQEWEVDDEE